MDYKKIFTLCVMVFASIRASDQKVTINEEQLKNFVDAYLKKNYTYMDKKNYPYLNEMTLKYFMNHAEFNHKVKKESIEGNTEEKYSFSQECSCNRLPLKIPICCQDVYQRMLNSIPNGIIDKNNLPAMTIQYNELEKLQFFNNNDKCHFSEIHLKYIIPEKKDSIFIFYPEGYQEFHRYPPQKQISQICEAIYKNFITPKKISKNLNIKKKIFKPKPLINSLAHHSLKKRNMTNNKNASKVIFVEPDSDEENKSYVPINPQEVD